MLDLTQHSMSLSLALVCVFTFLIHFSETIVYGMRLSGVRTGQIAIALSFVTSSLIVSRLSNMLQAPFLGKMVDDAILDGGMTAITALTLDFRYVIFAGFLGSLFGAFFTPTTVSLFQRAIEKFHSHGSIIRVALAALKPRNMLKILSSFRAPKLSGLKEISLKDIPKTFLVLNIFVTSIYTIGVLCALLAGAYLPDFRSTANQLSGIVNGIATILLTLFVDPSGARITDQVFHKIRPEGDLISVIFALQMGRLLGTLIIAQLFLGPFTHYIKWVTRLLSQL